jgi:hypothetical protein
MKIFILSQVMSRLRDTRRCNINTYSQNTCSMIACFSRSVGASYVTNLLNETSGPILTTPVIPKGAQHYRSLQDPFKVLDYSSLLAVDGLGVYTSTPFMLTLD